MSGVFVKDCACGYTRMRKCGIYTCHTDAAAVAAAYKHWQKRAEHDDSDHRYWAVHGPSGHVVAIKDSPMGDLPPPPLPYGLACRLLG